MKNRPSKKVFIYDSSDCTRKIVSKNFLNDFTHIRAYHACRPKDVGDYLKNGIQLFSIEKLNDLAAQLFNIPVKKIDHFAPTFQKDITNRIYFSLFKSELLKWSGHYLYYGSEHFLGIASYLDQDTSWHYRNILSQTGIPTIFTCDIAISLISKPQLLDIEKNFNFFNSNVSISISTQLLPEHIVKHEHPTRVFNPYASTFKKNNNKSCPYCPR